MTLSRHQPFHPVPGLQPTTVAGSHVGGDEHARAAASVRDSGNGAAADAASKRFGVFPVRSEWVVTPHDSQLT